MFLLAGATVSAESAPEAPAAAGFEGRALPLVSSGHRHDPLLQKVDPGLLEEIMEHGQASYYLILAVQADLDAAHRISDWSERGRFVYNTLLETARESQKDLLAELARDFGVNSFHSFFIINAVHVNSDLTSLEALAARPEVERVVPEMVFTIPQPEMGGPEALEWGVSMIRADEVWAMGITGQGVVVGTIDSGVQFNHPALVNSFRGTQTGSNDFSFYDPTNNCSGGICDRGSHGTHVTGSIVGDDGGANQIGVAPGATWIASIGCGSWTCPDFNLLQSAEWMVAPCAFGDAPGSASCDPDKRPHIVNNSWGGGGGSTWYQAKVNAWRAAGIIPVFAAGNSGPGSGTIGSPGDYCNVIGVGGTNSSDGMYNSSSRGPGAFAACSDKPDVSAPGQSVRSSVPTNSYATYSGTSMASPHVSGCIALMLSADPTLDYDEIFQVLTETAVDLGTPGFNYDYGHGRIDCFAAVQEHASYLQLVDSSYVDTCPGLGSGHEDGVVDPGEIVDLTLTIRNRRNFGLTDVAVTVATDSPDATILNSTVAYPDLAPGATADNPSPLVLMVSHDAPCGAQIVLNISLMAEGKSWDEQLTLTVGNPDPEVLWETGCTYTPCAPAGQHLVLVARAGTGDGTVTSDPAGINCGDACYGMFDEDTQVMLSAETPVGNTFDGWGGDCSGTAPCVLTVDEGKLVSAVFTRITHQLSVIKDGTGTGTVTSSPAGIDCGAACISAYDYGTVVTLTPYSPAGNVFAGWSGACTGGGTCTVTMDQARTVTATFNANTHILTVSKDGSGSGRVTSSPAGIDCGDVCAAPFNEGTVVVLSQEAAPGSDFSGWSGACHGTGGCSIPMAMSRSVTATFTRKEVSPLVGAAVRVDPEASAASNGNLILEPGETVVFHPAWHNPGLQGRTATGVATPAAGPGGDLIQVLEDTADYGAIPGGEIRDSREQTGNSYTLYLPVPAQRPSTLWRVEVTETLSTGDVHTWRIHIGDSFADVGVDHWAYRYIETLLHSEITSGCSPTEYCPGATVTRWQMAVFLAKAMIGDEDLLPNSGTVSDLGEYACGSGGISVFGDIPPTDPACRHIHYIAAEDITAGCGGGLYCPAAMMNRWQMAVFLAKAMIGDEDLLPNSGTVPDLGEYACGAGGVSVFGDIPPTDPACRHIHYIAAEDITAGCGGGLYCPADNLSRDQMAVFLVKAFSLSLY